MARPVTDLLDDLRTLDERELRSLTSWLCGHDAESVGLALEDLREVGAIRRTSRIDLEAVNG